MFRLTERAEQGVDDSDSETNEENAAPVPADPNDEFNFEKYDEEDNLSKVFSIISLEFSNFVIFICEINWPLFLPYYSKLFISI